MELMDLALQLGENIKKSEEYINLKENEEYVMQDEESKQLLNDLKLLQSEYMKAQKEDMEEDSMESLKHLLEMKKQEINEYTPTKAFFAAKGKFDILMKNVNNQILKGIKGEFADLGCGGGCQGCSNCGD